MAEQIQPTSAMVRRPGPRPPTAAAMTPKEIVGILRRHVWLIISSVVLGLIIGGVAWYLLQRFLPTYSAETAIEVLPPGTTDPMELRGLQPNKDLYYQFRFTKAAFIKQQSTLQNLLRRDKIRDTDWFKQFNNNIPKAVEELEDNLGASPQREGNWIILSMKCGNKKESALIVNEMLDLFLKAQQDIATSDIRAQLAKRTEQQRRLKGELQQAEDTLETIRKGTEFTNLGDIRFRSYLDDKISGLETMNNELQNNVAQLESLVVTLTARAEGNLTRL